MPRYTVVNDIMYTSLNGPRKGKMVAWDIRDGYEPWPTVAEIIEASQREFSGLPYDQLEVMGSPTGHVYLVKKQ